MDKRAIWLTIGLMTVALLGSIYLQLYWINWSVQLNRAQFDENVFDALEEVADRLKEEEDNELAKQFGIINPMQTVDYGYTANLSITKDAVETKEEFYARVHEDQCSCSACVQERRERNERLGAQLERIRLERDFGLFPLENRIGDPQLLSTLLDKALKNNGIDLKHNYGVFAAQKNDFVIKNGNFQVNMTLDEKVSFPQIAQTTNAKENDLHNSRYKVELYSQGIKSPGLLMVHFPRLTREVWKSAWRAILSALLFTGITLFCFIYTVQVIFRQKKVSEMKTDFINNMTHEFKTPIATISLAADSITSPMISGKVDKVNRFANIIKQENRRMLSQVEKVLQMAQLDKENFNLKITKINMHELVTQAIEHANIQVSPKNGIVTADLNAKNPTIEGDLTHISNIIHNLLDNANKYSPDKPEISVHTRNVSQGLEVIVKDKGIGMSSEARKHIFDKFYRVHTGNRHDVKGFGLGLSYVKAMTTAHHGQVSVKSELGKGSSFILTLPFKHAS